MISSALLEGLEPGTPRFWAEVLPWVVTAFLGTWLARLAPRGERMGWWLVAAACWVIVADKAFDLIGPVTALGRDLVRGLDPETKLRGARAPLRLALLGGLFLLGCVGFGLVLRRDRRLHRAKLLSILGLVAVMAYLGARLMPPIADRLSPVTEDLIEGSCWLCVFLGECLSLRRKE